jgi:hypothetical protein
MRSSDAPQRRQMMEPQSPQTSGSETGSNHHKFQADSKVVPVE